MVVKLQDKPTILLELEGHCQIQSSEYGTKLQIPAEPSGVHGQDLSKLLFSSPITFFTPDTCCLLARQPLICHFCALVGNTLEIATSLVEYQQ